jgi:hypothetical protein
MITIQGNGIVKTIVVTKYFNGNVKRPKVLLCFYYKNGITNEEEYLMFINELELFFVGTINLPL